MHINNYDQSSTGTNLELSACWDGDLARIWFDDCMVKVSNDLRPDGYYGDCYFYLRNEDCPPQKICDWFDLSKVTRKQLTRAFIVHELGEGCGYREVANFLEYYGLIEKELTTECVVVLISRELQDSQLAEFFSELAPLKFTFHQSRGLLPA